MGQRYETDQQIIRRVLHLGHRADYALLVDRYGAKLFAFVATIVTRREDAEELTEDCFVKAFSRLAQYDATRSSFYTWLRCIAMYRPRSTAVCGLVGDGREDLTDNTRR